MMTPVNTITISKEAIQQIKQQLCMIKTMAVATQVSKQLPVAGCVPQLVRERNSPCAGEVACTNSLYFDNGPEHLYSLPVVAPSPTPLGVNKYTINRGKNDLSRTLEGVLETCNQTH